ncbi:hypothetical protein SAMN05421682_11373 [Chryseobacterium indoltheticum]|uniref:Uncharacterized protein n=1 Tax=Chryseobacterium indoltheticum TaxID=254 RepID=A0A381F5H8_9FLAO|nr:hypothetical protein SAMN05421682_11373 [Chryseobacterium indoltheticum]SUX41714.1 Uncharacterised protein [Chryseobacterium indoltheticum]
MNDKIWLSLPHKSWNEFYFIEDTLQKRWVHHKVKRLMSLNSQFQCF